VFDEPTGSLDNRYRDIFLDMLFSAHARKAFTATVITHDYSIISHMQAKHRDRLDSVRYLELVRRGGDSVSLREFLPRDYLDWIGSVSRSSIAEERAQTVLKLDHDFSVFNRRLRIFRDEARRQPTDLILRKGEMAYVKAASGVGKTTLAKVVMGLYPADRFRMDLCGIALDEKTDPGLFRDRIWGRKAGMVFQHADESLNLQATVFETFAGLPLRAKLDKESLKNRLAALFDGEITGAFLDRKAAFLSGGQKQRLNILRTLMMDTDLVILDEPLNGLDFESIKKVLGIIERKRRAGTALLMISHNEEIFDALTDPERIYYLGAE
jgi:peptide/nickel transport system ATP-binding protein